MIIIIKCFDDKCLVEQQLVRTLLTDIRLALAEVTKNTYDSSDEQCKKTLTTV